MLALYLVGAAFLVVGAANQASQATAAALSAMGAGAGAAPAAASAPSVLVIVGFLALAVLAVWLLVDLCSLPGLVWTLNNKNAGRAIQRAAPAPTRDEIVAGR